MSKTLLFLHVKSDNGLWKHYDVVLYLRPLIFRSTFCCKKTEFILIVTRSTRNDFTNFILRRSPLVFRHPKKFFIKEISQKCRFYVER